MLKVLSGLLAQEKIPTATAANAEAALKVIHGDDIGVIVTDLTMPGMDGLQLLEAALRIDPALQVILITAHGTDQIGQRAWELGAAGYVDIGFHLLATAAFFYALGYGIEWAVRRMLA